MLPPCHRLWYPLTLEDILGKRPYNAAELRNIDKYRDGFGGKIAEDAPASEDDAPPPNESGDDDGGSPPSGGTGTAEPIFKRPIFGGGVVAT